MSLINRHITEFRFQPVQWYCPDFDGQDFGQPRMQGFQDGRCKVGLEDIILQQI